MLTHAKWNHDAWSAPHVCYQGATALTLMDTLDFTAYVRHKWSALVLSCPLPTPILVPSCPLKHSHTPPKQTYTHLLGVLVESLKSLCLTSLPHSWTLVSSIKTCCKTTVWEKQKSHTRCLNSEHKAIIRKLIICTSWICRKGKMSAGEKTNRLQGHSEIGENGLENC